MATRSFGSEERPLYAFLGLFILLYDMRFAANLMTSSDYREAYITAKEGHVMDFDKIANDYLHCPMENVVGLFLFACFLTPAVAFLAHRYGNRTRWGRVRP